MNIAIKALRGDIYRKTRAHSEKGVFGISNVADIVDAGHSLFGHLIRIGFGHLPRVPWLTWGAIRYLQSTLSPDARVFEFGGGMSTLWYEDHCAEVHTVEDNAVWYRQLTNRAKHARLYHCTNESFISSIDRFPKGYFDLIVVDGNFDRRACFEHAEAHLAPGGMFVVDDTDKGQVNGGPIRELDRWLGDCKGYRVKRFTGWVPASFWVKETTIAQRIQ